MKMIFAGYLIVVFSLGVHGIFYDKTDKNGNFKVNWPFGLFLFLFGLTPIIAKMCNLI